MKSPTMPAQELDPEKKTSSSAEELGAAPIPADGSYESAGPLLRFLTYLRRAAVLGRVEIRGIAPIPIEERTVEKTINIFTLWWSMNTNTLPITFGMLGPVYGLGLRDSTLVILFFTLLTTILPAYLSILGPKLGMRQMVQARYSFGRYLVSVPVLLNLATLTGFCVVMGVIGGQCLAAVADGNLSVTVGIVIIALLTLVISFCGFSTLHFYERYAWIPALVAILVAVGTGGSNLRQQAVPADPPTARAILSFGMIVASYMIPWACLSSDFTTYLTPTTSSTKIFTYVYLGLAIPTILLMVLGAAIGGATPSIPEWSSAYETNLVGGVLAAMLAPAGGFGKFLVVVLSFTLLGNLAATSYSITLNFQLLAPVLFKVPRYVFAVVLAAIVIPVSIRAAGDFFGNLENFIALIGYWSSAFLGVVLVEHVVFRAADCARYDVEAWNDARALPLGVAALTAAVLSFGLVVPSMDQVWFVGPIAQVSGDIGFELAFVVTALLYLPLRYVEKRLVGR
ncbi:permease for cytosine/purines, uracil, thiamine, allantoin-domain-containing protein [Podospora appendiculata]|uniref:Permease for cytosine/purines, uracil, thiamine, allantoin-domain-containing protein n=1 Tax=Podospora appendiculata TaxID=314037 RepID=A0AAE0X5V9_9PEZI|nr:permease for cytosine/purines, uracil, thiamine, allantoin-domain-containing protein [Podospora appendiculata]